MLERRRLRLAVRGAVQGVGFRPFVYRLARDLAIFAEHGYRLSQLRALDLFPMTHHVECVALLEPAP